MELPKQMGELLHIDESLWAVILPFNAFINVSAVQITNGFGCILSCGRSMVDREVGKHFNEFGEVRKNV